MHRRRWVIGRDRNMTTGFMARLCQFTHRVSSHGEIRSWQLNQGRSYGGHDQREEERVTFLPVSAEIGHVRWLVDTRRKRVDKVEEQSDDQHDGVPGGDFLEAVGTIIVRKRRKRARRGRRLMLSERPVVQRVRAELLGAGHERRRVFHLWGTLGVDRRAPERRRSHLLIMRLISISRDREAR
jgi:hypothetical protein